MILFSWAANCGLGINDNKTELILFSREFKIETFRLPRLGGKQLPLSSEVKYLDVVVDSKLNWKTNIEKIIKKD